MVKASTAANALAKHGLDGRDINASGTGMKRANPLRAPVALVWWAMFILLLPFFITSLGLQVLLGRLLGDSTDEGLDARTSYQFLAAFFGSLLVWPVVALVWTIAVWFNQASVGELLGLSSTWLTSLTGSSAAGLLVVFLMCFPLFWASGKAFAGAWDAWVDTKKAWKRRFMKRNEKDQLCRWFDELSPS